MSARLMVTQDPERSERLRQSDLMLSAWQEGVGDEAIGLSFEQLDLTQKTCSSPGKKRYNHFISAALQSLAAHSRSNQSAR